MMLTEAGIIVAVLFIGYILGFMTGYQKGQLDRADAINKRLQEGDY
jgi:ABC-type dipeptide/oligopeptide/nickel transport system permease subunit